MPKPKLLYGDEALITDDKTFFFAQDTRIVFTVDGRYSAQNLNTPPNSNNVTETVIGDSPIYILAAPNAKLYESGTVKGKILVYSPRGIVIETSLLYASSGTAEPHNNFLGLVSDKDVVVAEADVTGPGDLQIEASIYARRQFKVKKYLSKHAGTLKIHGSLTAGSISATEPRYATKIVFDKRLEELRPPNYPISDRYELALSKHDWKVETRETTLNGASIATDENKTSSASLEN